MKLIFKGAVLPLPKIHLVNQMLADRIKLTAAQVLESWETPLLGQEVGALMAATCYASNAANMRKPLSIGVFVRARF